MSNVRHQMILVSENEVEVIFQLHTGKQFKVSPIDKMFVIGLTWGFNRSHLQCTTRGHLKNEYLHVLIAKRAGISTLNEVDHRDVDTSNNRRDNLRPATHAQNQANKPSHCNPTGYKGVQYSERHKKFRAHAHVSGKNKFLGLFDTAKEAHAAYLLAAEKEHGEFARG